MKKIPRFSIITITWNNCLGLQETARSIEALDGEDFEWIIVDGGSNDETNEFFEKVIREFALYKKGRVQFKSEQDDGLYDAMNKGIERSKGEYLIFMNAGDSFANPKVLKDISSEIENTSADVVYGHAFENHDGNLLLKKARSAKTIIYSMFTHHQAIFYRRKAIGGLRYRTDFRISADRALTTQMYVNGLKFHLADVIVCVFDTTGISKSPDKNFRKLMWSERLKVYDEILNFPRWKSIAILSVKHGAQAFQRRFPVIYSFIRYSR